MRFCICAFLTSLSQRLRSIKNWLILLLLPVLILGASMMTEATADSLVTVGVVLPESGPEELWTLLSAHNNDILTFVPTDPDTIDRNVAAGKWDCGLIFDEDFAKLLEEPDLDRSVIVRIGPGSTVYPLIQETVSACLAQLAAPAIAREYLLSSGIADPETSRMEQRLEEIYAETTRVDVILTTLDGEELQVPKLTEQGTQLFLCWLISAVILVRSLFGAADLGKWIDSAAAKRMQPLQSPAAMLTAKAGADGVLMALSGCCAMLLLKGGVWGCLAILGYLAFWSSLSVLLAQFPRVHPVLPVVLPFLVVISFLMSSVLVDVSVILPALSGISQWVPAALFLRVCKGSLPALLVLLAATLLCGCISRAIGRFRE